MRRVVHHDREVVGGDTVTATNHEVVDDPDVLAVQQIVNRVDDRVGSQPQGGRAPGLAAADLSLGVGEVTTRAGVCALRGVRCTRRLLDIFSAAIAFVQQPTLGQCGHRVVVALRMLRLPLDRPVPGEADRGEIVELSGSDVGVRAIVEIVDAHQEASARGTGEQPCQHGGSQVADVQVGRRAGGEPARAGWGHAFLLCERETSAIFWPDFRTVFTLATTAGRSGTSKAGDDVAEAERDRPLELLVGA